jgi:integrase
MGVYVAEHGTFRIEFVLKGERYTKRIKTNKKWLAEKRETEWKKLLAGNVDGDCYDYTVAQIYERLLKSYGKGLPVDQQKASLEGAQQRWDKRLQKKFGHMKAMDVTGDHLEAYQDWCQRNEQDIWSTEIEKTLSAATINRDLSALGRAFQLAVQKKKIPSAPYWSKLDESGPRKGFVNEEQYGNLVQHAHDLWLRVLLALGYTYGCRRGELLALRVWQIDMDDRVISIEADQTKNGEGRQAVMTQEVYDVLVHAVAGKGPNDFLISRANASEPVLDFRGAWDTLCNAAGMPWLLFHDLRRSAIRNMMRHGISQSVAMVLSGHKTVSVFQRYNIVDLSTIREAAKRIEQGAERDREVISKKAARKESHQKSHQYAPKLVQQDGAGKKQSVVN